MKIEMRWFKSIDDDRFKLQFRQEESGEDGVGVPGEWQDIPFILE